MLKLPWLLDLLRLHATPGDEDEVREYLTERFTEIGFEVRNHGSYAISTVVGEYDESLPTVLVCGHMDSPGFIVEQVKKTRLSVVKIGGPHFKEDEVKAVVKTASAQFPVTLKKETQEDSTVKYYCDYVPGVKLGDRVCYYSDPQLDQDGMMTTPFLDNRAGCYMLLELARAYKGQSLPFNLVLGANGTEEMCGFGARILAEAVKPDFVVCLDATYTSEEQGIVMGKGPVITLSDASVLLSIKQREALLDMFYDFGVEVQTEVYNYSGTDSKAFPMLGLPAMVVALLLPTEGNHTPHEKCNVDDFQKMFDAVQVLVERGQEYGLY